MREVRWLLLWDPKELEGQIRKQIIIQESVGTEGEGGQEQRRGRGKGGEEVGGGEVEVEGGSYGGHGIIGCGWVRWGVVQCDMVDMWAYDEGVQLREALKGVVSMTLWKVMDSFLHIADNFF